MQKKPKTWDLEQIGNNAELLCSLKSCKLQYYGQIIRTQGDCFEECGIEDDQDGYRMSSTGLDLTYRGVTTGT